MQEPDNVSYFTILIYTSCIYYYGWMFFNYAERYKVVINKRQCNVNTTEKSRQQCSRS